MADEVASGVARLGAWLREAAWPLWLERGIDRQRGGFFEALDLTHSTCSADYRRLRVVARQIYVFSEAHRAGQRGAAEAVQLGLNFLDRHAVHDGGGYAWRFDLDHRPIDVTRDLYDHAFVLLALASATAVIPAETLRLKARELLAWIEREFAHPGGGYLESLPPALPRRQNPHMHFLEAALAAYEAFGDKVFLDTAGKLVALFAGRLFDHEVGALPEFFDDRLSSRREQGAFLTEPGHHCEWVWLLHWYQIHAGQSGTLRDIAARLMLFVDSFGIHEEHGAALDGLNSRGEIIEAGARLWPQTERLKAEFLRDGATPKKQMHAINALSAYLRPDGLWHDRRDANGVLTNQPAPASSLYHLTCAILTAERHV
jgi:mannose/cellobiose epimerase-like protein (N-acyl-D-glucosamine 2-epimerase family)